MHVSHLAWFKTSVIRSSTVTGSAAEFSHTLLCHPLLQLPIFLRTLSLQRGLLFGIDAVIRHDHQGVWFTFYPGYSHCLCRVISSTCSLLCLVKQCSLCINQNETTCLSLALVDRCQIGGRTTGCFERQFAYRFSIFIGQKIASIVSLT